MNTRRFTLALALSAALLAAPAHAVGPLPLELPGSWVTAISQWLTSLWAPVESSGALDPNGSAEESTTPVQSIPPPYQQDGGGCLDPHGRPTPCSPGS